MQPPRGRAHQPGQVAVTGQVAQYVEQLGVSGGLEPPVSLADRPDAFSTLACRASKCCGSSAYRRYMWQPSSTEITASSVMAPPSRIPDAVSFRQTASYATGWPISGGSG